MKKIKELVPDYLAIKRSGRDIFITQCRLCAKSVVFPGSAGGVIAASLNTTALTDNTA